MTYKWLLGKNLLYELKRGLIKHKLIETHIFQNFNFVFSNNTLVDLKEPIVWLNTDKALLYFITELMEKGVIAKTKRMDYKLLISCFVNKNNEKFENRFRSYKPKLKSTLSTKTQILIDKIIQNIIHFE